MKRSWMHGTLVLVLGMILSSLVHAGGNGGSSGQGSGKIDIEKAQRDFQIRYELLNGGKHVGWLPCSKCSRVPTPPFPKNDFYGTKDLSELEKAALVGDLVGKFWGAEAIYGGFVKNEPENNFPGYTTTDFPTITRSATNPLEFVQGGNTMDYRAALGKVQGYIQELKFRTNGAGYKIGSRKSVFALGGNQGPEATCDSAKASADSYLNFYISFFGWDSSDTGNIGANATTSFSLDLKQATRGLQQGQIFSDLTAYKDIRGVKANAFLKVEHFADGVAFEPPVEADPPGDAVYKKWTSATAGEIWESDVLGDDIPTEWPSDCPTEGAIHGWQIVGMIVLVEINFQPTADPMDCQQCTAQSCTIGATSASNGCVQYVINLGKTDDGEGAGFIWLNEETPRALMGKPDALRWVIMQGSSGVEAIKTLNGTVNANGNVLRQVRTPDGLVDIVPPGTNDYVYDIKFYKNDQVGSKSSGVYQIVSGQENNWFKKITVENPDMDPEENFNTLIITDYKEGGGVDNKTEFEYSTDAGQTLWDMSTGWTGSAYLRWERRSQEWIDDDTKLVEIHEMRDGSSGGTLVEYHTTVSELFDWGLEVIEEEIDPDGPSVSVQAVLTSRWDYYTDPEDEDNYGRIKQIVTDTGYWERYEYDTAHRISKVWKQYQNSAAPDIESSPVASESVLTEYSYNPLVDNDVLDGSDSGKGLPGSDGIDEQITLMVEKVNGVELGRTWSIASSGGTTSGYSSDYTWDIYCPQTGDTNGAWNAPGNLVILTESHEYTDNAYEADAMNGKPKTVKRMVMGASSAVTVQTITKYNYNGLITTIQSGIAGANGSDIAFGTETVTETNDAGYTISSVRKAMVNNSTASQPTLSSLEVPIGEFDDFRRPTRVDYLDGTYTESEYACCGLIETRNREGLITTYDTYDALERVTAMTDAVSTSGEIETHTKYDAAGRTTELKRKKNSSEQITIAAYDAAGRLIKQRDPDGYWTFHTYRKVKSNGATFAPGTDTGSFYNETRVYPHQDGINVPVQVTWEDGAGRTLRSFTMSVTGSWNTNGLGTSLPSGSEAKATEFTRSETEYDWRGRSISQTEWYDIANNLSYETEFFYDLLDRQVRVKSPIGDYAATVYDARGNAVSEWHGTDATGATAADPDGSGSPNNMVKVSERFYDADMDGDEGEFDYRPFVTSVKSLAPVDTLSYSEVRYEYDAYRRQEWTKPQEADGGAWTQTLYDAESSRPTESIVYSNGSTSYIVAKSAQAYDATTKRKTTSRMYEVNGSGGLTGKYLETAYSYDDAGRQIKVTDPKGGFTKTGYDELGRVAWTANCSKEGSDASATTLVDDIVLTETIPTYSTMGDVLLVTTYTRNHDGTATGSLSSTPADARITYQATWYDAAHRPTHVADYGNAP